MKKEDKKDKDKSETIKMKEDGVEEILTEHSQRRTKETKPIGASNESFDLLNETQGELMAMVQGNSDNIRPLNDNVATLTEGILKIEEKFDNDELKSLKLELKKSLKAQKDIIKSNLKIGKDYTAVKAKLTKVYGREFFERRR